MSIVEDNFSFWRYSCTLPVRHQITLGEPITPIIKVTAEGRTVDAKLEYLMPTGSFKDRGAAVLVSAMKDAGVDRFMEDSSGNAGAALAAYAARAGIQCDIYCPEAASAVKLNQIIRTGANIHRIDGPRDNTMAAVMSKVGEVFYASHNWHPLFLHGTKTMAYEIAEQYGWHPPQNIVAPTGGGAVLLGLHLGFGELARLGKIVSAPKLYAVQAEACAPLVRADVKPAPSIAEGILTSRPPRLELLRATLDGVAVVSEAEILKGYRDANRLGLNVEPTSAVVFPGLRKLAIHDHESVLLVLTGSGLKSQVL
jgi:threonine synthase